MKLPTQPLREEHKGLLLHLEHLKETGNNIEKLSKENLVREVEKDITFLKHHLLIHAQAEEKVLYPTVSKLYGNEKATAVMSREHREIESLIQELKQEHTKLAESASYGDIMELRRLLYGLYTLIKAHFNNEEEVYLPLIDAHLSEKEASEMYHHMEQEAQKAMTTI